MGFMSDEMGKLPLTSCSLREMCLSWTMGLLSKIKGREGGLRLAQPLEKLSFKRGRAEAGGRVEARCA